MSARERRPLGVSSGNSGAPSSNNLFSLVNESLHESALIRNDISGKQGGVIMAMVHAGIRGVMRASHKMERLAGSSLYLGPSHRGAGC